MLGEPFAQRPQELNVVLSGHFGAFRQLFFFTLSDT